MFIKNNKNVWSCFRSTKRGIHVTFTLYFDLSYWYMCQYCHHDSVSKVFSKPKMVGDRFEGLIIQLNLRNVTKWWRSPIQWQCMAVDLYPIGLHNFMFTNLSYPPCLSLWQGGVTGWRILFGWQREPLQTVA